MPDSIQDRYGILFFNLKFDFMTTVTKTKALNKPSLGQMVDQDHLEIARTIYQETRWEFHNKRLGRNDSLSVSFDLPL